MKRPENYRKPRYWYGIYDARTDEILAMGSAEECAKNMGISIGSFREYISRKKFKQRYEIYKEAW